MGNEIDEIIEKKSGVSFTQLSKRFRRTNEKKQI